MGLILKGTIPRVPPFCMNGKKHHIIQITNTEPQVQPKNFRNRYIMGLGKCSLSWHPHID